jgi:hypothetical protein
MLAPISSTTESALTKRGQSVCPSIVTSDMAESLFAVG